MTAKEWSIEEHVDKLNSSKLRTSAFQKTLLMELKHKARTGRKYLKNMYVLQSMYTHIQNT